MSMSVAREQDYTAEQRTEAAEWFVVMREDQDPDPELLQAWLQWMEASAGNRSAFQAVERAWHQVSCSLVLTMPGERELAEDHYDGAVSVMQWRTELDTPAGTWAGSRRRRRIIATAAVFAVLTVVGGWIGSGWLRQLMAPSVGEFVTATGEDRTIVLADGSRVQIGARSRLVADFTAERRGLWLESGEAYFSVRRDPGRPFTVHTPRGEVTALGTEFNVRTLPDRDVVVVTEGAVSVASGSQVDVDGRQSSAVSTARRVRAGQQLIFGGAHAAGELVVGSSLGERARWREGWLVYRDEPLGEVLADVARYSKWRIDISEQAVAELRFSGAVHRGDIDEWLFALPESFPIALQADSARLLITASRQ